MEKKEREKERIHRHRKKKQIEGKKNGRGAEPKEERDRFQ